MRKFIFAACTLLSSLGFYVAVFSAWDALFGCKTCLPKEQYTVTVGSLFYAAMLISALLAYFRMGIAWVQDRRLGSSSYWPVFGTAAAISTLYGVGLPLGSIESHLTLPLMGLALTFPAIVLATWLAVFHSKRTKPNPTEQLSSEP